MAKDENGLDLALEDDSAEADDDVIDLLEVVKPGKATPKASDEDEDFSADLESMLETLSKAEQTKAAEEGAQPFPDPTPVDHEVDPDESLDMPGMDDLDDILNALDAPAQDNSSKIDALPDVPDFDAGDMPDLDAVPAAQGKTVPPPPSEADLLAELGLDDAFSPPASASPDTPQITPVDLEDLPLDISDMAHEATPVQDAPLAEQAADATPDAYLPAAAQPQEAPDALDDIEALLAAASATNAAPPAADPEKSPEAIAFDADFEAAGSLDEDLLTVLPDLEAAAVPGEEGMPEAALESSGDAIDASEARFEPDQDADEDRAPDPLDTTIGDIASESLEIVRSLEPEPVASAPPPDTGTPTPDGLADAAEKDLSETDMEQTDFDATLPLSARSAPGITEEDILPAAVDAALDSAPSSRFDEVDLNELDALLDDMLASAPASGPSPMGVSAEAARETQAEPEPQLSPQEEATEEPAPVASATDSAAVTAAPLLGSELASLRLEMDALRRDLAAARPSSPLTAPAPSAIDAKIEDLELTLQNLDGRIQSMEYQLNELYMNIDKFAAEAAAKIIREELSALLEAGV